MPRAKISVANKWASRNDAQNRKTQEAQSLNGTREAIERPTQGENIVSKFGGPQSLARLLNSSGLGKVNPSTIYRWTYPRDPKKGGTNGVIPTRWIPVLIKAARLHGIFLSPEDLYPELY